MIDSEIQQCYTSTQQSKGATKTRSAFCIILNNSICKTVVVA